jgi:hypothetical protein
MHAGVCNDDSELAAMNLHSGCCGISVNTHCYPIFYRPPVVLPVDLLFVATAGTCSRGRDAGGLGFSGTLRSAL